MESTMEQTVVDHTANLNMLSVLDYAIVLSLIGLGSYWLFLRKKKSTDFDANSIKTFSIEPTLTRSVSESGFISKMKSGGRNIVVFYGSQTGTAEEFAARLAKEATRYGMKAMVADPEECDMEELSKISEIENSIAVFCMATYGEGDPTDNAQEFYEWLQNGGSDMTGLRFAVFALGNKTYEHYNSMGIYVDKRLEELGATRVHELGLGDDDANIEEDFISWKEKFWTTICEQFGLQSGEEVSLRQYELVSHDDIEEEKVFTGEPARIHSYTNQKPPYDAKNPYLAPILVNRELYKGERSCLHIEFEISDSKLRYEAGDHVAVYPKNDSAIVEKFGTLLDIDLDKVISLKNLDDDSSKKNPFPCPCSYRTALSYYVDITSLPRTHVLKEIAEYAKDEQQKTFLKSIGSSTEEGKAIYHDWIIKNCRSIIHVLEDLPSVKPPLDHLLELMPRLQVRYYSISSSPKLFSDSVHITGVVINYETNTGRNVKGVATTWLQAKRPSDNGIKDVVPIFIRRSQFRLPAKSLTPIIMIGPGTGFAPFRGFIQERWHMKQQNKPVGDTILYYGCRKKADDFLYEQELDNYVKDGTLTKLYLAFSRDSDKKVYVQHLMKENMKEIWDVIGEKNGHIYICGDARNMAREVKEIILATIEVEGKKSKQEAEAYFKRMETQRRFSADVWS